MSQHAVSQAPGYQAVVGANSATHPQPLQLRRNRVGRRVLVGGNFFHGRIVAQHFNDFVLVRLQGQCSLREHSCATATTFASLIGNRVVSHVSVTPPIWDSIV